MTKPLDRGAAVALARNYLAEDWHPLNAGSAKVLAQAVLAMDAELARLEAEQEILREVAVSGVSYAADRYVEVQINRAVWNAMAPYRTEAKP